MSIDREKLRQKTELAKAEAHKKRELLKNPPEKFVDLPELTGDPEIDSAADLEALDEGFRKRSKDESKRFQLATDSEYWACICFQTREQKDKFLQLMNLIDIGDKYLDGALVAKRLGIDLPQADVPYNTSSKIDAELLKLVKE